MNKALTAADFVELERMLVEIGVSAVDAIGRAKSESRGIGLFVRSLVGMDLEAAKKALGEKLCHLRFPHHPDSGNRLPLRHRRHGPHVEHDAIGR